MKCFPHGTCSLAAGLVLMMNLSAPAAEVAAQQMAFFENNIRPLLTSQCYGCHSLTSGKTKAGLALDTPAGWKRGGESGPALVPGKPEQSLLLKAVNYKDPNLQMPPKQKLSEQQIANLTTWIKMGAPDPRGTSVKAVASPSPPNYDAAKKWWAFQPVKKPTVPLPKTDAWAISPVDNFILAKLEEKGLRPNPQADKHTLLRRATFDLTGLPPTSEEMDSFLQDESPDAFAKVVDRLLASPRYGECWGRHWLDTARYADTKGQVKARQDHPYYPFAWTYRDYVIEAFNKDKPFNVFIIEQIAADRLPVTKETNRVAALGFLTLGDRFDNMINDIIADRIDVVTKGFLGLTVSCARCHDHKFDPISQKDYYALHGIFASSAEPKYQPILKLPDSPADYADYVKKLQSLEQEKAQMESRGIALRRNGDPKARRELQRDAIRLRERYADLDLKHPGAPVRATTLADTAKPHDSSLLIRGENGNPGESVPRRFLEVLGGPNRPTFRNGSGRLELSHAIASPDNPLTARVFVNRVWQNHFGEGIVTTPDDFGTMSTPPSHPELLDYLAAKFMEDNWSVKKLHRVIMLTRVYQQSGVNNPANARVDPQNRLLWKANVRRLDFEAVRDSILQIGGHLDLTMGGKPVDMTREPYSMRRSVYGFIDRRNLPELFVQFDFANPDVTTGKRYETMVPQQALFLMNSPLVVEQARHLTQRTDFLALSEDEERIQYLYAKVYQRPPTPAEIKLGLLFLQQTPDAPAASGVTKVDFQRRERNTPPLQYAANKKVSPISKGAARKPLDAWTKYAHALLESNEAMFVN